MSGVRWDRKNRHTMSDAKRPFLVPPSTRNRMQIAPADTTSLYFDVDIVVLKRLRLELLLGELKLLGVGGAVDLEAGEGVWVTHCENSRRNCGVKTRGGIVGRGEWRS